MSVPERLDSCYEKLRWHAFRAEQAQAQIEEMERAAEEEGMLQQVGRMERADGSLIADTFMGNVLLRDRHAYLRQVGIRNAHQAQVGMYSALISAGVNQTAYRRVQRGSGYHLEPVG